jgi:CheY-like chemotaxis protein
MSARAARRARPPDGNLHNDRLWALATAAAPRVGLSPIAKIPRRLMTFSFFRRRASLAASGEPRGRPLAMSRKRTPQARPVRRRILIIDDHPLVRRGLKALIDAEPDLVVCAEAADCREGLEAAAAARPDLAVVDLSFRDGDGLELVRAIRSRYRGLRVLVLTMHYAPVFVRRAFAAGADGYVAKHEMTGTLLMAIRNVLRGETYGAPAN